MRKNASYAVWLLAIIIIFNVPHTYAQHLRELADQQDILIGSQAGWGDFAPDNPVNKERKAIVDNEYNAHTGGASFTPKNLQPKEGEYFFDHTDQIVAAVKRMKNPHKIHAAHLVGRNAYMPSWWNQIEDPAKQEALLKDHIEKVMTHYRGDVDIWDIVNESLDSKGHEGRWNWGANMCLKNIGMEPMSNTDASIPKFIRLAFEWAEAADPASIKLINESQNAALGEKNTEICYEMVEDLIKRSVPIDGVGFQMHLKIDAEGKLFNSKGDIFSIVGFQKNMQRYADLRIDIYITEFDIQIPESTPEAYQWQQRAYFDVVTACLSQARCRAILMWGLDDANAWHKEKEPTLFSKERAPKPAYFGFQEALKSFEGREKVNQTDSEP